MKSRIQARVSKAKQRSRSPWPRSGVQGKHIDKQGFANTRGKGR